MPKFKVCDKVNLRCGWEAGIYEIDEGQMSIFGWYRDDGGYKHTHDWTLAGSYEPEPVVSGLDLVFCAPADGYHFALDYDKIYTLAPGFWDRVIKLGGQYGIRFTLVTARRDTPENRTELEMCGPHKVPKVFANRKSMIKTFADRGIKIDGWIDDDPESLVNGHS